MCLDGDDPNVLKDGKSLLMVAIENDDESTLATLLQCGCIPSRRIPELEDENIEGVMEWNYQTPLCFAIQLRKMRLAALLIQAGASVLELVEVLGWEALTIAAEEGEAGLTRLLTSFHAFSALFRSSQVKSESRKGSQDGVTSLVPVSGQLTPLAAASYHGYANVVRILLDAGDVTLNWRITQWGRSTALLLAAARGHYEVVTLLIQAGADYTVFNDVSKHRTKACSYIVQLFPLLGTPFSITSGCQTQPRPHHRRLAGRRCARQLTNGLLVPFTAMDID
eukprot:GILJ01008933.1.p1 GENE.GILJ01008933.1~~GILJ01008933.1.p1  ORF type:complete len:280 (-),score=10.49 GILJ01008933.1:686-1525(-)